MTDRLVRKIGSALHHSSDSKPFSSYLEHANIVLLGDPGAGKTHLFKSFAEQENAGYYTARSLLIREIPHCKTIYIDALDEKRAGRGNENVIDEIVKKLFELKPTQVRISCRSADWLGGTDLEVLKEYFAATGKPIVVNLEALTEEEQLMILRIEKISEPENFLQAGQSKKFAELLVNPQNLIMLAKVVQQTGWPLSVKDLYEKFVEILLNEHNQNHQKNNGRNFSEIELIDAAGNICAIQLISDVSGICLASTSTNQDIPSYRSIAIEDVEKIRAALGRRIFVSGNIQETVDYTHRTTAEYLAALWISKRVMQGLPFGRVRALIGIDGQPASALRGLHAWLSVFLPNNAIEIIDADPFGVLVYGDAASLSPQLRQHLFKALAKLEEVDPWFRRDNWSSNAVAALSAPDMLDDFRSVLRDKERNPTLRSIVLDALSAGSPIPELENDLATVLIDPAYHSSERHSCFKALLKMEAHQSIVNAYRTLDSSEGSLELRASVLSKCYGVVLSAKYVVKLLNDALASNYQEAIGSFWHLPQSIPDRDIKIILKETLINSA